MVIGRSLMDIGRTDLTHIVCSLNPPPHRSHRSVLVNLFGIPLNLIVVAVFLSINRLGVAGALSCAAAALAAAALAQISLALVPKPAA